MLDLIVSVPDHCLSFYFCGGNMRDFGTYVHIFVLKLTDCYITVNKLYVQDRIVTNHAIHVGIQIYLKVSFCEKMFHSWYFNIPF